MNYARFSGEIERFGADAVLAPEMVHHLMMVFEEVVFQGILPATREGKCDLPLAIRIEHADMGEGVSMRMTWGGESFDPLTHGDELSLLLVGKIAKSASFRYENVNELLLSM